MSEQVVGAAVYSLNLDDKAFKTGIGNADKSFKDISKGAGTSSSALATLGKYAGAALGAVGLAGFIQQSITAFSESQRVMTQTTAVIRSTGGAAGLTAQDISKMAAEIQKTTPIADDAAQSGMNMLLTFTNIGKDVFPQASQAMIDMATAMNGGLTPTADQLSNTAVQLGKALQDPVQGVSALRRVGVNFNETQLKMIEGMVESGRVMEAQKYILKELSNEFGGSAAAQLDTFAGRMQKLQNQFGDTQELIGGSMTPALLYLTDALGVASDNTNVLVIPFQALASVIIGVTLLAKQLGTVVQTALAVSISAIHGEFDQLENVSKVGFTNLYQNGYDAQTELTKVWQGEQEKQTKIAASAARQQEAIQSEKSKKIAKDLEKETRKFNEENDKRTAKFKQSLADLIFAHQDKVKSLTKDIESENKDYNDSLAERNQSFSEKMADMKDTHAEKVADIEQQIAEETAKGAEADATRLADLQARLAAENAAYDKEVQKATEREKQEQERLKKDHEEKLAAVQAELDAEKAILDRHKAEVDSVKDIQREDDIQRLVRQYNEENEMARKEHLQRMNDIRDRGDELGTTLADATAAGFAKNAGKVTEVATAIGADAGKEMEKNIRPGANNAGRAAVEEYVNGIWEKSKSFVNSMAKNGMFGTGTALFTHMFDLVKNGLPGFADGVSNFAGGLAVVGERGPEIVNLPKGASVTPNNQIGKMGTTQYITINVGEISNEQDINSIGREIGFKAAINPVISQLSPR